MKDIKLIAFDLDGTLTQHRSPLEKDNREMLFRLAERYKTLMVGAGDCLRIFSQMEKFPIDIIGNYGMQQSEYSEGELRITAEYRSEPDRESVTERINMLREEFGFTVYAGDTVEFHSSGMVTFPIIGTGALLADKLAFDPDRRKRRAVYERVAGVFGEYNVFIGGSSSFDMAPKPYCKSHALAGYMERHGILPSQVVYFGDDYLPGGNDHDVTKMGVNFVGVDDYRDFILYVKNAGII